MSRMVYDKNTVYFISYAQLPENISAKKVVGTIGLGIVVDFYTDIIVDTSCTLITEEAREFLKSIIVGYNLSNGIEELIEEVRFRFNGQSQKSVCVVLRDVHRKYLAWKEANISIIQNSSSGEVK